MTSSVSSTNGRTAFGKCLIFAATGTGRAVYQLESKVLRSTLISAVPFKYRYVGFQLIKLTILLAVASIAISLALGIVAVWVLASIPISTHKQPRIHEMSHPQHQTRYPEMYDDDGGPR